MILQKPATRKPHPPTTIARRTRIARSAKRIRRKATLGARRRAAKAAGGVEDCVWEAICDFYRDASGVVRCAYGETCAAEEQDHVVPIARNGRHEPGNVVPICRAHNARKGTQTWEPKRRHPWMVAGGDAPRL